MQQLTSTADNNLAETIVREARKPLAILSSESIRDDLIQAVPGSIHVVAVPKDYEARTFDFEHLLPGPRAAKGIAAMQDANSFTAFVARHATEQTIVWCQCDPVNSKLQFIAVLDDHARDVTGWRALTATYVPEQSVELTRWLATDKKKFSQLEFAEHIERNQDDIASPADHSPTLPTSIEMLKMATEFEANADRRVKSAVRTATGGVNLTFVDDEDAATVAKMSVFDKFGLGLPVFRGEAAFLMLARLRWTARDAKVTFHYELLRADKIFERAALDLIEKVRVGLGDVPLLMGAFNSAK